MRYTIGGKIYTQKALVLGQLMQLSRLLSGVAFTASPNVNDIIISLGNRLPLALAIVLIPDGVQVKDKDISAIAESIEYVIDPETALKVVNDFFDCNPVNSLLEQLIGMSERIQAAMQRTNGGGSSAPLQEEISQSMMTSSGDLP